jgi:hypothetical protein
MALRVSEVFMAGGGVPADPESFRLAAHHVEVLRDVARGAEESDAGLCCSYLADVMSGEGADYDEHALTAVERFADRATEVLAIDIGQSVTAVSKWRGRVLRCRRALRRLRLAGDHKSASVLLVAYGYPDPLVRQIPELARFPAEHASLARYTDAVEARRKEMVEQEARALHPPPAPGDRYREGGDLRGMAERDGFDPEEFAKLVDLGRYRDKLAWADRAIGSADALRAALAPFGEPRPPQGQDEPRHVFEARLAAARDRHAGHKARVEQFVTELKIEARRMLLTAERAYHACWLQSAG